MRSTPYLVLVFVVAGCGKTVAAGLLEQFGDAYQITTAGQQRLAAPAT